MEILFLLVVLILGLLWLLFTYLVPIIAIILVMNGIQIGWIFLIIWFIGITISGVIRECKEVKNDKDSTGK
jgi:hypothetical protein